jgi:hypothetical protein
MRKSRRHRKNNSRKSRKSRRNNMRKNNNLMAKVGGWF